MQLIAAAAPPAALRASRRLGVVGILERPLSGLVRGRCEVRRYPLVLPVKARTRIAPSVASRGTGYSTPRGAETTRVCASRTSPTPRRPTRAQARRSCPSRRESCRCCDAEKRRDQRQGVANTMSRLPARRGRASVRLSLSRAHMRPSSMTACRQVSSLSFSRSISVFACCLPFPSAVPKKRCSSTGKEGQWLLPRAER